MRSTLSIARVASMAVAVLLLLVLNLGCQETEKMMGMGPSIRGNYVLDYRELPGGKGHVRAPDVIGFMSFTHDTRNFNVYWTDNGKPAAVSTISHYTFDG